MYHLSILPPKQHKIPLIISSQISIPNVSPNLTDAHILQLSTTIIVTLWDDKINEYFFTDNGMHWWKMLIIHE